MGRKDLLSRSEYTQLVANVAVQLYLHGKNEKEFIDGWYDGKNIAWPVDAAFGLVDAILEQTAHYADPEILERQRELEGTPKQQVPIPSKPIGERNL